MHSTEYDDSTRLDDDDDEMIIAVPRAEFCREAAHSFAHRRDMLADECHATGFSPKNFFFEKYGFLRMIVRARWQILLFLKCVFFITR